MQKCKKKLGQKGENQCKKKLGTGPLSHNALDAASKYQKTRKKISKISMQKCKKKLGQKGENQCKKN